MANLDKKVQQQIDDILKKAEPRTGHSDPQAYLRIRAIADKTAEAIGKYPPCLGLRLVEKLTRQLNFFLHTIPCTNWDAQEDICNKSKGKCPSEGCPDYEPTPADDTDNLTCATCPFRESLCPEEEPHA